MMERDRGAYIMKLSEGYSIDAMHSRQQVETDGQLALYWVRGDLALEYSLKSTCSDANCYIERESAFAWTPWRVGHMRAVDCVI